MLNDTELDQVVGATAYSTDGQKIGKVGQVFLDDETGRAAFATVHTGLFGSSESFVPLADASLEGDRMVVPFSKDQVKDAPNVATDAGHMGQDEERRLYAFYGLTYGSTYSEPTTDAGPRTGAGDLDAAGNTEGDTAGDTAGEGAPRTTDDAMTRSEEHLTASTRSEEAGRARLRKYVVTEEETVTVPVRKERATLEREPITEGDADDARSGPAIAEDEHEVVLHEERPVVETTAEPVERVRLGKESTTEEEAVSADVRKERIEVDGDVDERS